MVNKVMLIKEPSGEYVFLHEDEELARKDTIIGRGTLDVDVYDRYVMRLEDRLWRLNKEELLPTLKNMENLKLVKENEHVI